MITTSRQRANYVAPESLLERQLVAIWEELLDYHPIGIRDNFFDIGGHSLLAAKICQCVQTRLGFQLDVSTLFEGQTIQNVARLMQSHGHTSHHSPIVPLKPDGTRTPLFLIHGADGTVNFYRQLAAYLDPSQPVFALQFLPSSNMPEAYDIEALAAYYVSQILTIHPHGPCMLGGYCMGGSIAFEMARQLRELGREVKLLVLFETYNMATAAKNHNSIFNRLWHKCQNAWFHLNNWWTLDYHAGWQFARTKFNTQKIRSGLLWHDIQSGLTRQKGERTVSFRLIRRINDRAHAKYIPRVYAGNVVLFKPSGCFSGFNCPDYGWSQVVAGNLDIVSIPAFPRGMMIDPFVRSLAFRLNGYIHLRTQTQTVRQYL